MKGDNDVDVFVLFPKDVSEQQLTEQGLEIGKSVFEEFDGEFKVEYAEHPYTRGEIQETEVEIVPCYDVEPDDIRSSVDRTPHHSEWVRENLDSEQREEAVLLKAFLKSAGIYGSSLKVRGFSGYLCEILVAKYGDLKSLAESAREWGENETIDPADHHEELAGKLVQKFEDEPLVVIDPVDPKRNVASVLSRENYSSFVYRCWNFAEDPGMDFFEPEDLDFTEFELEKELDGRAGFIVMRFERPEGVEDVVYPQMRKTMRSLRRVLKQNGFRIYESGFHIGEEARIFFELQGELPEIEYVEGPKVFHNQEHLEEFRSKYSNVFIREDRLTAKTRRKFTRAVELIRNVSERPDEIGIPDRVAENFREHTLEDPLEGGHEWLKYLAEELYVEERQWEN